MRLLKSCPVCESTDIRAVASYDFAVSSDSEIVSGRVDNALCEACGVVYNASGVRGLEKQFFERDYALLTTTSEAQFEVQTHAGPKGLNARYLDWLAANASISRRGTIVELGAGKGLFLRGFLDRFPEWRSIVFEPSGRSLPFLRRLVPEAEIHGRAYEDGLLPPSAADLIVAIGVLEHVPEPVSLLQSLRKSLSAGGSIFLSVPNFERNPADLLTYDHLTRFTPDTLRAATARAGYAAIAPSGNAGVPCWMLAQPTGFVAQPPSAATSPDAARAAKWLDRCFAFYGEIDARLPPPAQLHVFGTGLPIIGAVAANHRLANRVAAFIDDNKSLRGATRIGRPVIHWDDLQPNQIEHLTFSASPVYLSDMERKARAICGPSTIVYPLPSYGD
jgi:SAM-dependent methyltransferase